MLTVGGERSNVFAMDPAFLLILAVIAVVVIAWYVRRRADAGLTPEQHLERAVLQAEQDRQRTSTIEAADRYNVTGPPNP